MRTKTFDAEVKASGDRSFTFTISTANPDRDGDTIAVEGWELANFRNNPVVLWAHDHRQPPLGQATWLGAVDGALKATVKFASAGTYPLADIVHNLIDERVLRATSVGFIPLEWKFREDGDGHGRGIDFLKQELIEFSIVSVPANAEALIGAAKAYGLDPAAVLGSAPRPPSLARRLFPQLIQVIADDAPVDTGHADRADSGHHNRTGVHRGRLPADARPGGLYNQLPSDYESGYTDGEEDGFRRGVEMARRSRPAAIEVLPPPQAIVIDHAAAAREIGAAVERQLGDTVARAIRQLQGRLD